MNTLKIFSDLPWGGSARAMLADGVAPHELLWPARPAVSVLAASGPDPAFAGADIAFGQPGADVVLQSRRLRWLHLASAGFTRFDTPEFRAAAARRRLLVTNSSAVYAGPCAEQVFAFMLAQARQLPLTLASRCANGSDQWNQLRNQCASLSHQNVLLLGFGAIARRLVELLRPFEPDIAAFRREARGDEGVPVVTPGQLPAALASADQVVNLLPDNADSRYFFSAERLAILKPGPSSITSGAERRWIKQPCSPPSSPGGWPPRGWMSRTRNRCRRIIPWCRPPTVTSPRTSLVAIGTRQSPSSATFWPISGGSSRTPRCGTGLCDRVV
jgi:phosphoglycerate dehydrogenase-like enzyme